MPSLRPCRSPARNFAVRPGGVGERRSITETSDGLSTTLGWDVPWGAVDALGGSGIDSFRDSTRGSQQVTRVSSGLLFGGESAATSISRSCQ